MGFDYKNVQHSMHGGKKTVKKVIIKNGKGTKSICKYKNGKKCRENKQHLSKDEIQLIKLGKFIPGLFSDISEASHHYNDKKTRKNRT